MGVEIVTDNGPFSVMWTNRFFPYGVEVFHQPIADHLVLGPQGPEGWSASESKAWRLRLGSLVRGVATFWDRIEVGPALNGGGDVVAGPASYDVPVALRMDLEAGPVWMVAGIPQHPDVENVFVPGDEIVVAFGEDRMRKIGSMARTFSAWSNPIRRSVMKSKCSRLTMTTDDRTLCSVGSALVE